MGFAALCPRYKHGELRTLETERHAVEDSPLKLFPWRKPFSGKVGDRSAGGPVGSKRKAEAETEAKQRRPQKRLLLWKRRKSLRTASQARAAAACCLRTAARLAAGVRDANKAVKETGLAVIANPAVSGHSLFGCGKGQLRAATGSLKLWAPQPSFLNHHVRHLKKAFYNGALLKLAALLRAEKSVFQVRETSKKQWAVDSSVGFKPASKMLELLLKTAERLRTVSLVWEIRTDSDFCFRYSKYIEPAQEASRLCPYPGSPLPGANETCGGALWQFNPVRLTLGMAFSLRIVYGFLYYNTFASH